MYLVPIYIPIFWLNHWFFITIGTDGFISFIPACHAQNLSRRCVTWGGLIALKKKTGT